MREFERVVLLNAIDRHWMDHIDAMDDLRNGIGLRAYGQRNPVQEYKMESYDMFNDMVFQIREDAMRRLYQSRVERLPERRKAVETAKLQEGFAGQKPHGRRRQAKAGRRAHRQEPAGGRGAQPAVPVWQSGKKYKHCCGKICRLKRRDLLCWLRRASGITYAASKLSPRPSRRLAAQHLLNQAVQQLG